jgi:hypothetical protein
VEPAVGGGAAPPEKSESDRARHLADDGQIVVVRPQVVENVGHVLGNLFQRMYHLIDRTREADAGTAAQLEASTHGLEDFLQLVIDYVSPLSLSLQRVPASEVVQSLARQLSDELGSSVAVDVELSVEHQLLIDPGRLARGFGLLARQLGEGGRGRETGTVAVWARPGSLSLAINVVLPSTYSRASSSVSEIEWSVAEKLLEIQGGSLLRKATPAGEVLWEIVLPLQP